MRFIRKIKRIWKIAGCSHRNSLDKLVIGDYSIHVCKKCGRVIGGIPSKTEEENGACEQTY